MERQFLKIIIFTSLLITGCQQIPINESNKNIRFDSIDLFWTIEPHIRAGVEEGHHPPSFLKYIEDCYKEYNYQRYQGIIDIIQHSFHSQRMR